ncbi:hypothetical protein VN24_09165 [Paenibacillus beijingensis]|uniref:Uncharacterized protein n=1 Tax=Paenibacillus beijingensis TaxID=1126833 RepID=A0A0D5NHI7_9BACL|nr:hypothetical protein VN24_09165 [Paenibacillus beijingensis]
MIDSTNRSASVSPRPSGAPDCTGFQTPVQSFGAQRGGESRRHNRLADAGVGAGYKNASVPIRSGKPMRKLFRKENRSCRS